MAADVLLYNALNEINRCLITQNATLDTNIATQNSLCTTAQNTINTNAPALVANSGPNQANMWCLIPTLPATGCSWTTGLQVCDSSGFLRCGVCCAWTVPGGASCARFQIWGAGGMGGYGCCCAFAPFGGTGAYASVIIPVTPGDTYTLCAGCAFCCCACAGGSGNNVAGCASFVTGTGLTNFCAEGGESDLYCQMVTRCTHGSALGYCMFLGGCICSNNSVCWNTEGQGAIGAPACCFDNMLPMISSCKRHYGSATSGTVFGIRGSYGSIAVNCNGIICVQHPPIYGFASSSCCAYLISTNYAGGYCRSVQAGYMAVPSAGASAFMKCGGNSSTPFGDFGRGGMVCVSYR